MSRGAPGGRRPGRLLERRLHFVVGKGGVGKTTVAAALALAAARRGRRTLAIEMQRGTRLASLLGVAEPRYEPQPGRGGVQVLAVEGRAALEEYLQLIIPVRRLLSTVFHSRIYQYFVAAAPGLKELMTVGKVWYEAERQCGERPCWDSVVVDAPATGHSLQYLRMPQAVGETFGPGLVRHEAERVLGLLADAGTTAVHLVTTAEEMPVTEAIEAYAQLTGPLGLPAGALIVNRLHDGGGLGAGLRARLRRRLERLPPGPERELVGAVARRADEEASWAAINAAYLERLKAAVPAPMICLPFVFAEEFGAAHLDGLSRLLEEALLGVGGREAAGAQRATGTRRAGLAAGERPGAAGRERR